MMWPFLNSSMNYLVKKKSCKTLVHIFTYDIKMNVDKMLQKQKKQIVISVNFKQTSDIGFF